MIEKIKLNNGIEMPMEGFGVFQIPEEDCEPVVRNAYCRRIPADRYGKLVSE